MNVCLFKFFILLTFFPFAMGCGAVGSPIPPEDVGIEAKVRRQQKENALKEGILSENGAISDKEEGVELPAFYPIGKR